jgi:hypothetical protein
LHTEDTILLPRRLVAPVSSRVNWILFALFGALSLLLQLPGNVPFDGIVVWYEADTAQLYAQHPAALVLVWRVLEFVLPGPALFTAAQLVPLWLATKLVIDRARPPLWLAALFYAFVLVWPPLFAMQGVTVKDVFGGHLALLAFVLILPPAPHRRWVWGAAFACATLATLLRYQFGLMLPVLAAMGWWELRRFPEMPWRSIVAAAAGVVGTLAVVSLGVALLFTKSGEGDVNLSLRKMMVFDIAGVVAADHAAALPVLREAGVDVPALKARMLAAYSPVRVDTLWEVRGVTPEDPMHSGVFATLAGVSNDTLLRQWLFSARHNTGAFVQHHAAAFARVLGFGPIYACRPIRAGISWLPKKQAAAVHAGSYRAPLSAKIMTSRLFPVGVLFRAWLYVLIGLGVIAACAWKRTAPEAALLAGFGLAYELSFLVLSQACEVRYSYPLFLAALFAAALLSMRPKSGISG